jgi:hypothetical protein
LDSQTTLGYQPAQYAIGTFTANGTSQLIKIVPNASVQMNAIQVRDVTPGVVTLSPVLYNGNGATGGSVPVDGNSPYTNGVTVTVLGNSGGLSKPLCTFTNWNTAADGSGTAYNPGATFTITNNVTLYAQWTGQTITLIDPVSGTAAQSGSGSTNWGGQGGSMSNLFNSSGLSSTLGTTANSASLPVLNNGDMDATGWRATTFSTPSVDFTFDLGMTTNIMGIVLGNYFEPGQYARGVQSFDLQLSSDHGGTWTTVGTIYPALADASGQLQIIDFGTNYAYVTDVRFSHASNTGGSFGFIGLNEVRFLAGPYVAPPPRTLVYNGNGNTGGSVPVDGNSPYADGSTVTVLGNTGSLTKAGGATFAGWNTHANGSGTAYSPGNTFTLSANTTLYAQWNVNPITWQTPVNLAGDSDVATDGTLVYAYTESDTNGTVNGVTFAADGNYPTGLSSLGGGNVTLSGFTGGPGLGVWFTQTNPVSGNPADYSQNPVGLSVDYQNNIGGAAFGDVGASTEVLLNNLTPGRQYLVQFWVCDYRAASGRSETLSAGNVSGVLTYAQPVSGAASGTYVKGTFTAHSSGSQLITLLPAGSATAQMNAIMVRDVTVTAPPVLSYIQSGSGASATLTFNWTGSGSLEWQTNSLSQGLGTNWVAYPNGTNGVSVPVDTTKGSVFFRVKQ